MIAFACDRNFHGAIERCFIAGEFLSRSGPELERGCAVVDHGTPFGRVFFGQQSFVRNLNEVEVAEIFVAIGESELGRFDAGVNIVRAVVAQLFQVIAFKNSQREQFSRSLTGGSILVDLISVVIDRDRLFNLGGVVGKVLIAEQAAVFFREFRHLARDVALVKAIACRFQGLVSSFALVLRFRFDQPPHVPVTPAPSPETLRILRTAVAAQLIEIYPKFAAEVFGVRERT